MSDKLYVVTCIFNPCKYNSRLRLYNEFAERMRREPNVHLFTVSLEYNGFAPIQTGVNCCLLGTRPDNFLFLKENLINIGIKCLPDDAQYIAWIDADMLFTNHNWVRDTISTLKENDIVQMFETVNDLSQGGSYLTQLLKNSFPVYLVEKMRKTLEYRIAPYDGYSCDDSHMPAYGLAWAATREFLQRTNGLEDTGIIGSGDYFMDWALVGRVDEMFDQFRYAMPEPYREHWRNWQKKANGAKVGYIPGLVLHYWHGDKCNRRYDERHEILERHNFTPSTHMKRDANGLWECTYWPLKDDLEQYFYERKEDG